MKQAHVTRKVFTVGELRAVLGVGAGKLERFANLNARALQPAIEEISTESRFVLTATPRKSGRTITSIEISWTEKTGSWGQSMSRPISTGSGLSGGYLIDPAELFRVFPAIAKPNAETPPTLGSKPHC